MAYQIISLLFLITAIVLGFTKKMNVGVVSMGMASMMNSFTASPIIGLTAGIMSWFSSANGVVFPTLIPTVPDIVANIGGNVSAVEMITAIVGGATVAGISPLSTGGSLILASYTQETKAPESEQQSIFGKLFLISFGAVMIVVIFALVGGFKIFY